MNYTRKTCKKVSPTLAGTLSEVPVKQESTTTDVQEVVFLL